MGCHSRPSPSSLSPLSPLPVPYSKKRVNTIMTGNGRETTTRRTARLGTLGVAVDILVGKRINTALLMLQDLRILATAAMARSGKQETNVRRKATRIQTPGLPKSALAGNAAGSRWEHGVRMAVNTGATAATLIRTGPKMVGASVTAVSD